MLFVTEWRQITARTLFEGARILADYPEGLPRRELWDLINQRLPGLEEEWAEGTSMPTTALTNFGYYSINLVKAGWLRKERQPGRGWLWYLTPAGREALGEYRDPESFWAGHAELYGDWEVNRDGFERARELIGAIPDGSWAAATDIAREAGLHASFEDVPIADLEDPEAARLVQWAQGERPPRWPQVLDPDGGLPRVLPLNDDERDDWIARLAEAGVAVTSGRVNPGAREPGPHLADLVSKPPPDETLRRAWLVRGANVQGENLIPFWLDAGVCSLPAARLRHELKAGDSRQKVRNTIHEDYSDVTARRREQMAASYHAFLSRMREGDIVVTYSRSDYYFGTITGEPRFVDGDSGRAGLRRTVDWADPDDPVAYAELPDELPNRLGNPDAEVVELTEFVGELEKFLGGPDQLGGLDQPVREAVLPDIGQKFAEDNSMPDAMEFLTECVELLRDRPQMIFYGPPGTGKTHLARKLAKHLTGGGPDNDRLVQFHPAYSYEDFFQGYRPNADGSGLEPYPGPLKQLANLAQQRRGETFVLIIDEINRGNLAKIFGELYFLLEYRKESVVPPYSPPDDPGFSLPRNLVILGTMNTADRSIALVDAAIRRRFWFTELHPDASPVKDMLPTWLADNDLPPDSARLLDALNAKIQDRDFKIGPSFLMRESVQSVVGLERVWRHQILPLLEEHHYGEPGHGHDWVVGRYGLDALRSEIGLPAPGGFGS